MLKEMIVSITNSDWLALTQECRRGICDAMIDVKGKNNLQIFTITIPYFQYIVEKFNLTVLQNISGTWYRRPSVVNPRLETRLRPTGIK